MIKNFRVPIQKYVIEIPTGVMDKKDVSPEVTARRELMEETGYTVDTLIPFPSSPHTPGSSNNLFTPFIGLGATKVSDQAGDVTEDIEIMEVTVEEMMELYLRPQTDTLFNIRTLALYFLAVQQGVVPDFK